MAFTEQQQEAYKQNNLEGCPFCSSWAVETIGRDYGGSVYYLTMLCNKCKKTWYEEYILNRILPVIIEENEDVA